MIHEKLRNLRKQKGLSQERVAKALCTDTSNYCRKERGEIKIHDEEWARLAQFLNVSIEEIKNFKEMENRDSVFTISNSIIENLQEYIRLLKQENESLKKENTDLKSQLK